MKIIPFENDTSFDILFSDIQFLDFETALPKNNKIYSEVVAFICKAFANDILSIQADIKTIICIDFQYNKFFINLHESYPYFHKNITFEFFYSYFDVFNDNIDPTISDLSYTTLSIQKIINLAIETSLTKTSNLPLTDIDESRLFFKQLKLFESALSCFKGKNTPSFR